VPFCTYFEVSICIFSYITEMLPDCCLDRRLSGGVGARVTCTLNSGTLREIRTSWILVHVHAVRTLTHLDALGSTSSTMFKTVYTS
jgi:hypothetical protein